MGKKHRNETEEERKERKRAKKEAKKAKKAKNAARQETQSDVVMPISTIPIAASSTPNKSFPFIQKRLKMTVSLYPVALGDVMSHIRESLRSLLLKYSDGVGGILLGFDNVEFSNDKQRGFILNELPQIHYSVELDALVFCPEVGGKLTGVVNECFPSHVGMLVHSFFNAMVPSDHMRAAGWLFDAETQQWQKESDSKVLGNEDKVDFVIDKIHESEGIISMEGSHPSVC